jgi:putative transposase
MTRPLRIEYPGALYHVTARGNRRAPIYHSDSDRYLWLEVLDHICERFHFVVHAFCQMSDHYHIMIETVEGNLAQGMRQLNGIYSQKFNRRHAQVGHAFQGRYKAILVQKESYLLELSRYIVLNPVRAGITSSPQEWPWSSYNMMVAQASTPRWLNRAWLLAQFDVDPATAVAGYREFVHAGIGKQSPLAAVSSQLLLGDDDFCLDHATHAREANLFEVARPQRRISALSLPQYDRLYGDRDEAIARAYWSTAFTMTEIGHHFGLGRQSVSRAVARFEMRAPISTDIACPARADPPAGICLPHPDCKLRLTGAARLRRCGRAQLQSIDRRADASMGGLTPGCRILFGRRRTIPSAAPPPSCSHCRSARCWRCRRFRSASPSQRCHCPLA